MWHHLILLALFPCLLSIGVKSLEHFDGPIWRDEIVDPFLLQDDLSSENIEMYRHRNPYENTESNFPQYPRSLTEKRALAMFARWGSINGIGKNRPPIRSHPYDSDNTLNKEYRRMQGQPLRWG